MRRKGKWLKMLIKYKKKIKLQSVVILKCKQELMNVGENIWRTLWVSKKFVINYKLEFQIANKIG